MVYMMLFNLLFLFRKIKEVVQSGLDLVSTPKMAHSLQYSTIRATNARKKDHFYFSMNPNTYNAVADNSSKSLGKKVLDKCASLCYNRYIIENTKKPIAALPVNYCQTMPIVHITRDKPNMTD